MPEKRRFQPTKSADMHPNQSGLRSPERKGERQVEMYHSNRVRSAALTATTAATKPASLVVDHSASPTDLAALISPKKRREPSVSSWIPVEEVVQPTPLHLLDTSLVTTHVCKRQLCTRKHRPRRQRHHHHTSLQVRALLRIPVREFSATS